METRPLGWVWGPCRRWRAPLCGTLWSQHVWGYDRSVHMRTPLSRGFIRAHQKEKCRDFALILDLQFILLFFTCFFYLSTLSDAFRHRTLNDLVTGNITLLRFDPWPWVRPEQRSVCGGYPAAGRRRWRSRRPNRRRWNALLVTGCYSSSSYGPALSGLRNSQTRTKTTKRNSEV